ncbi:MAG: ThuA domain-containing protein [Planctomycetota bacterium]
MRRLALVASLLVALPAQDPPPRVLFLTHSAGFVHPVVKRAQRAMLAHAERCFVEAAGLTLRVDCTQDCAALKGDSLRGYQVVVFYTTGELPIDDADKEGLLEFVREGGGFVGIHCATDTFYKFPAYGAMIGGYFDGHPWHKEVRLAVEDRTHPTTFHLGESLVVTDEIYQFRAWSRDRVHVLLRLTDDGTDLSLGKRADRDNALSWCRDYGKGRVFYTALGHRPEVWRDARFLTHLLAGVRWTIDRGSVLSAAPPSATPLGADGSLIGANGGELAFTAEDGVLEVQPGRGSAVSVKAFRDHRLHVEFTVPEGDAQHGNSGVYVQRRYEVQILDSFGKPADKHACGALYGQRPPDFNASRAAGAWQTFDIWFTAARFDGDKKTANARVTVLHNGILVHRDAELTAKTGQGMAEGDSPQPLLLQDHGSRVRFRNLWIQETP